MASIKGGHDYEFVSDPPKSLECSICLLTLKDPCVVSCCGNHYCKPCIGKIKEDNKPCPLCNDHEYSVMLHKGVMREVNSLKVYCPQRFLGCNWKGEIGQVQRHENIGSRDSGCGYIMIKCIHQCGGKFQRRVIAEHESMKCPKRPKTKQNDMLESLLAQLQPSLAMNAEISKKLDILTAANQSLEARCTAIEAKNKDLQAKNEHLERMVEDMQREVNAIMSEDSSLKEKVNLLELLANKILVIDKKQEGNSKRLDRVTETMERNKKEIELQINTFEMLYTPSPPFYFTLYNFQHYRKVDYHWESKPFYTFPRGYKLSITIYPNGMRKGKGTHVSLFISIIRGEFDDQLKWPFIGTITLELFNFRTTTWDKERDIEFEERDSFAFTQRPVDCQSNPGLGFPQWKSIENVIQQYCHKDMVWFRVSKVIVAASRPTSS